MKKWVVTIAILLIISIVAIFILIQDHIAVTSSMVVKANPDATFRLLQQKSNWEKFWPVPEHNDSVLYFNNRIYKINKIFFNGLEILVSDKDSMLTTTIYLIPFYVDSVRLSWSTTINAGKNPIKKLGALVSSRELEHDELFILSSIKSFLEKQENVYGMKIEATTVKDTILVTTKQTFNSYPSVSEIYGLVDKLRNYVHKEGAIETNYPMLHIQSPDKVHFQTMVAIPVNKRLSNTKEIEFKRMVPLNILVAQVKGGNASIQKAISDFENYMTDYKRIPPAISFQLLVTDRSKESDTTKWLTRLYYPVY